MDEPFVGSEAFVALHHDVYLAKDAVVTPLIRAKAAWLRSRRRGVLGARWIDRRRPAAIIDTNRRRTRGVHAWADSIEDDEICVIDGMRVTTPERTALDIACRYSLDEAVAAVDALARATRTKMADVELLAERYGGRRGIRCARKALDLVDPGGFPRPRARFPCTTSSASS